MEVESLGQIDDDTHGSARVPSRFEIVNALAWVLAHVDALRAGGCASMHALDQALQEHEVILVKIEERASAGVYQAARRVWASIGDEDNARILAWIIMRAADLRDDGQERHDAIEQAITDCQETWTRATRRRTAETHQLARWAWAAASEGDPRFGPGAIVDALDAILVRALVLYEGEREPGDAITCAMREHGARGNLARMAVGAWAVVCQERGELMTDPSGAAPKGRT